MKGLYTRVIAGKYDSIPNTYSKDLTEMLKACLIVKPQDRANCDQILALPITIKHMSSKLEEEAEEPEQLLNTIKMPRQLTQISNIMPASQYNESPKGTNPTKLKDLVSKDKQQRLLSAVNSSSKAPTPVEPAQKKRTHSSRSSEVPTASSETPTESDS